MKTKIAYIGKFQKLWDEEYIARAFEKLDCEVLRVPDTTRYTDLMEEVVKFKPDFVLFAKFDVPNPEIIMNRFKKEGLKTVCWIWDLYFGYQREHFIDTKQMFRADIVITSDGGHQKEWEEKGIKHFCVRQGIYEPECYVLKDKKEFDIVFVGSENPFNKRQGIIQKIQQDYPMQFHWFGRTDTNEVRGEKLNELYAKTKIVIGDSVYSPFYWSNRVVETLGRGGFLIHQEVEGLKEEYPFIVTYKKGDYEDLKSKIDYYLTHDKERETIIKKNLDWVKGNHLCEHKCKQVLEYATNN